jgi:hypothetical protein
MIYFAAGRHVRERLSPRPAGNADDSAESGKRLSRGCLRRQVHSYHCQLHLLKAQRDIGLCYQTARPFDPLSLAEHRAKATTTRLRLNAGEWAASAHNCLRRCRCVWSLFPVQLGHHVRTVPRRQLQRRALRRRQAPPRLPTPSGASLMPSPHLVPFLGLLPHRLR